MFMTATSSKNMLEELLYHKSLEDIRRECKEYHQPYSYKRGMFISVNNYKQTYEQLHNEFRNVYTSITRSICDRYIHRGSVCIAERRPPNNLLDIINAKKLLVVACLHDYSPNNPSGRGRTSNQEYKHTHFYVYGAHYYLTEADGEEYLKDEEDKLKRHLYRYTKLPKRLWNKSSKHSISIRAVGMGEHRFTERVSPTTLHQYLTDASTPNIINYMRNNRHRPEVQYPLYYLWEK